jgi:WD40 repeat protein
LCVEGSEDGLVKLWNLEISDFTSNLKRHIGPVLCVDMASDDAFVASGSADMTVKVWSVTMACVITDYKVGNSLLLSVNPNTSCLIV